jgi:carboxylesterase type B
MIRRLLCALATCVLLPAAPAAAAAGDDGRPVVGTDAGAVRGAAGPVESFLGIPYAAPPTGALRWQPPQPAVGWSGTREAAAFGSRCPALAGPNGPRSESEDCLFVNVQRPAGARPGDRLPVYVFIHGGALVSGGGDQMDMDQFVSRTGVVAVTFNYRLGVFGFLRHPALTAATGESGNFGFLDQQAALRWVQRNIAAFGGAPDQVTIGGESAGGLSVCVHLVAPGSRGLFARAMIQSGACGTATTVQEDVIGLLVAAAAGCTDGASAAACLRALPAGALLDAGTAFVPAIVRGTPTLPVDPRAAVRDGTFAEVPLVIGANRDEGRALTAASIGATQQQYTDFIRLLFGDSADAVLAQYPWPATANQFTAAYLGGAVATDAGLGLALGGCPGRTLIGDFATHTRTYAYEFDHRTGPGPLDLGGFAWGASHTAELAYLWPSFDNGTPIAPRFTPDEQRLSVDMTQYWGSFIRTGQPAAPNSAGWPDYQASGALLSLEAGGLSTLTNGIAYAALHNCAFWDPRTPAA